MQVRGTCHCGQIAYEADVDPEDVSVCHCTDCQMLAGSAYRVSVRTLGESFRLLRGEPKSYTKTAQSGARRAHSFCGNCEPTRTHARRKTQPRIRCVLVAWSKGFLCHRARRFGVSPRCHGPRTSAPSRKPVVSSSRILDRDHAFGGIPHALERCLQRFSKLLSKASARGVDDAHGFTKCSNAHSNVAHVELNCALVGHRNRAMSAFRFTMACA